MTWCGGRYTSTMLNQPKSWLMDSLSLCLHLNHPCLLQDTYQGVSSGLNPDQPFLLNQPPLPQSPPSQPPRHASLESAHHTLISQSEFASRSEPRSPATPGRTNDNSQLGQPLRRSARLNPMACTIKSQPQPASAQSRTTPKMARTYPLSLKYRTCLGRLEDL